MSGTTMSAKQKPTAKTAASSNPTIKEARKVTAKIISCGDGTYNVEVNGEFLTGKSDEPKQFAGRGAAENARDKALKDWHPGADVKHVDEARKVAPPKSMPEKKPAKKPVREGLAKLIEADMQQNITTVLAVQVIPDKLKTMAETLAKIEGTDLMPLSDQLRNAVGPGPADRFYQTVTAKVRELLDAVKAGKDAIDAQITNLQAIASGEPGNDMANDLAGDPSLDPTADAEAPEMDGPPAPGAAAAAPDADAAAAPPPPPDADADDELPPDEGGAAGRLRKESAIARRVSPAIRALRESSNPDAVILTTFRAKLKEGRGKAVEAVMQTAKMYEIDASDVVSIVKEAKAAAKRPFNARATPLAEKLLYRAQWNAENHWFDIVDMKGKVVAKDVAVTDKRATELAKNFKPGQVTEGAHRNEVWVGKTLSTAKINHIVEGGTVYVTKREDIGRAQTAMKANPAVDLMPIKVRESAISRKPVHEAVPVKPMSPADMRAAKQQGKNPKDFAHDQSQAQSTSSATDPMPIQTKGMSGPKSQAQQPATNAPSQMPDLPGKVLNKVAPVVGGQQKPSMPSTMPNNAQTPQNGTQNGQSVPGEAMQTEEGAATPPASAEAPAPAEKSNEPQSSVTLFSKMTPLPKPKHELMGAVAEMPKAPKVNKVAESKKKAVRA